MPVQCITKPPTLLADWEGSDFLSAVIDDRLEIS